jgi:glycosyltransferase involved in cell wall biosynthesis
VVGGAGLVFSEENAEALKEHLMHLMRDPELWSSLAQRGRDRVLAHFTQAQIAAQTVAVYRELAETQAHPRKEHNV